MRVSVELDFGTFTPTDDDIADELNRVLGMVEEGYREGEILSEVGNDDDELLPELARGWWRIRHYA